MVSLDALEEREASEPHPLPITPGRAALRDFKPAYVGSGQNWKVQSDHICPRKRSLERTYPVVAFVP